MSEILNEIVSEIKSFHWSTIAEDDDNVKELDVENIVQLIEAYHQSKLQALKEDVKLLKEKAESKADLECMSWDEAQEEAYGKVLNLITNLEYK